MDDAIVGVHHTVVGQPKLSRIALEGLHLSPRYRVGYRLVLINKGSDDVGKVHMQVEHDGHLYYGFGANTDIVTASVDAYIDCINKFKTAG